MWWIPEFTFHIEVHWLYWREAPRHVNTSNETENYYCVIEVSLAETLKYSMTVLFACLVDIFKELNLAMQGPYVTMPKITVKMSAVKLKTNVCTQHAKQSKLDYLETSNYYLTKSCATVSDF